MSDNNVFMISDIDDSESDELSGEYKNDTINVPDQALNSDAYLDFNSQNTNKCESIIHNALQNIIPKNDDKINNNENSNDDKDFFMVEKDDIDSENDQHSSKNSDQEIETENDNEEETKNEINDEVNNEEEADNEINNKNSNEEEADNEINDSDKEKETKNEINDEDDNEEETEKETNDNEKEIENEVIDEVDNDGKNSGNINFANENNNEENNVENNYIVNDEKEGHYESQSNGNDESIDEKVKSKEKNNEKINNGKNKKNINEANNAKDRKNECNGGLINITDESNNFADESNDFADNSSHDIHENNKDDAKNPIVEPPAKEKSERPHPHRKLHRKKKSKTKNEKEDEITENENDVSTNEKETSHKNQSTKTKDKTKPDKNVKEESINHTIDEIAVISINNGDYSLINQSNIEKVMSKIRKMQRDALDEGDYELAKKAQLATQSAIQYYNEKQLLKHNSNRACEINVQLQATRNDIGFLKEHWARVLENAKQKANADLLQLRDEQDKKLKEFDDKYKAILSDPENLLPLEYKKSSSAVLLLRKKQSIFINTNNFKMAKEIKKELKELEEKERNENFLKFQKKKTAERNLLIKKQDEMFAVRKENWYRTIEGIKSVANYEIEHARKSEKQLESKFMQTNEFSNKLIRQQQQRTSSLKTKKKEQGQQTQQLQGSDGENVKMVTHTQFTIQRSADKTMAQEFRQRAMINRIIYTNRITPKVRKPVPKPKPRRQYPRTPR